MMDAKLRAVAATCAMLVSGCLVAANALAGNDMPPGGNLVFAAGYGVGDAGSGQATDNMVLIGSIKLSKGQLLATYREFDAGLNKKPLQVANVHHKLKAPSGKQACADKLFEYPSETRRRTVEGQWASIKNGIQLTLGDLRYDWINDGGAGAYRLERITDVPNGRQLPLVTGYAYGSSGEEFSKLSEESFLPWYDGEINHKNNNAYAPTAWETKSSGFKTSVFTSSDDGDLLSYSSPGQNRAWVGNGILLNHDSTSNAFIYQDLGHDFNRNGCYDEFGHNKILLAAHDEKSAKVTRMVYIEYSYSFKGFPMLSVGRYHK